MTQRKFILDLCRRNKDSYIVGSLGTISYDLEDTYHKYLYLCRGAMGCVVAIGLGLALSQRRKVIVVIGDGSLLMKLGSLSTVLKYKPRNLKIICLQNNTYASTGNQKINFKYIKKYLPPIVKIYEVTH